MTRHAFVRYTGAPLGFRGLLAGLQGLSVLMRTKTPPVNKPGWWAVWAACGDPKFGFS